MILADTSVLSLAFRRRRRDLDDTQRRIVFALEDLFSQGQVVLMGPVRQELLSGIAVREQFDRIKTRLAVLDDLPCDTALFELAAEFHHTCRSKGIAPGDIDMMIAAASIVHGSAIFTADPDFSRYARHLPINLHKY